MHAAQTPYLHTQCICHPWAMQKIGYTTGFYHVTSITLTPANLQVAPEPVTQWQNVAGNGHNILEAFYADKKRFAYTFQNYIFLTRFMQASRHNSAHMESRSLERSERKKSVLPHTLSVQEGLGKQSKASQT